MYYLFLARSDRVGPARILAPLSTEAAAWSPDSKRIAFSKVSSDEELGTHDSGLPKTTRIYVVAIDGSSDDMIFQQPGYWQPEDWSPDGKKLLILDFQYSSQNVFRSNLVELDMNTVKTQQERAIPEQPWQRAMVHRLQPVLPTSPPALPHGGRYSPDGRWIAAVCFPKREAKEEWKAIDFELGVIERATSTYRKIARYPEGLRGPICWSPDNEWILFSRPLAADDLREQPSGPQALRQENGLGIWAIKPDGTGERFLTTGWSPDWR